VNIPSKKFFFVIFVRLRAFYEAALHCQSYSTLRPSIRVKATKAVTWDRGPKPGGLLFALSGDRWRSPRSMSFAAAGAAQSS